MRAALPLGFLLLLGFRDDSLDALVRNLGSEEVEVRDDASARLRPLGLRAHEVLQRAEKAGDPEVRARARSILDSMVSLEIDLDFDRKRGSRTAPLPASLRLVNGSDREILAYRGGFSFRVQVLELFEQPDGLRARFGTRFGCGGKGCPLLESDFIPCPAGRAVPHALGDLQGKPSGVSKEGGPITSVPGRYRITASYEFQPEVYRSYCRRACGRHEDPEKPWNRCAPRRLEAEAEFVILP